MLLKIEKIWRLIDLMVFTQFQLFPHYMAAASAHIHAFLESLFASNPHCILSKPLTAFPHTTVETKESGESGINPVAMTIINPRKELVY